MFATYGTPAPLAHAAPTGLGDATDPNAPTGPSTAHTILVTAGPAVILGGLGAMVGAFKDKMAMGAIVGAVVGGVWGVYNYSVQKTA
jgi:hypothetical protein